MDHLVEPQIIHHDNEVIVSIPRRPRPYRSNSIREMLDQLAIENVHLKADNDRLRSQNEQLRANAESLPNAAMPPGLADQAFFIPLISENVFQHLHAKDLLNAMQVNKTWFHTVNNAPHLQRKLFLLPDPKADFEFLPFTKITGVGFNIRSNLEFKEDWHGRTRPEQDPYITFQVDITQAVCRASVGRRLRQMLLTQPPVTKMRCETSCCGEVGHVANSRGLRVGDLLSSARKTIACHMSCREAYEPELVVGEDGVPVITVTFSAYADIAANHPLIDLYEEAKRRESAKTALFEAKLGRSLHLRQLWQGGREPGKRRVFC